MKKGTLVISLDFELIWGVFDHVSIVDKKQYFDNTLNVIPKIIESFVKNEVKATWATVGMLFNCNWEEWEANSPLKKPSYTNTQLDAYSYGHLHKNLGLNRFFFAPNIIQDLQKAEGQEVGTHTYSHYYCLEGGQNKEQFEVDLDTAIALANKFGISLKSLVFPRNQFNAAYLECCAERGISSVRSNPDVWYWDTLAPQTLATKVFRTADAYVPLGVKSYPKDSLKQNSPLSQPSSRFLRPQHKLELLNSLRLIRIKNEIIHAARNGEIYHLWWHPHNFGIDPEGAMKTLKSILEVYSYCKNTFGMESKTMEELQRDVE
ncbi:polysaccharide deacetylase family protein [Flavobacterium psychrotolerans]|uniref:Polysaccharide deacetylase n=1 Tax=Flavobacterium psychrotolerans TaxID=2169410 RepID=A0A2U1JGM4_9FLAO|nr:polysaccharide deacetylase family protein [Flavobacterium psychrotolerans]PWA04023.1 polysaccharide deacetylase [Flavobacterium psychrotolerans]